MELEAQRAELLKLQEQEAGFVGPTQKAPEVAGPASPTGIAEFEQRKELRAQEAAAEEKERQTRLAAIAKVKAAELEVENKFQADKKALTDEFARIERENQLLAEEEDLLKKDDDFEALKRGLGEEEALRQTARLQSIENEKVATLERQKIRNKARANEKKQAQAERELEQKILQQRLSNVSTFFSGFAALARTGGKKGFEASKALAISDAIIQGFGAVNRTLNSVPFPFNIVAAAGIAAQTAANVQNIRKQQPGFQEGGIIPGAPTTRDSVSINAAPGELVLNRRQQANLFNQINGGGVNAGTNNISVNVESLTGQIPEEQVNNIIEQINDQIEFRNADARFG